MLPFTCPCGPLSFVWKAMLREDNQWPQKKSRDLAASLHACCVTTSTPCSSVPCFNKNVTSRGNAHSNAHTHVCNAGQTFPRKLTFQRWVYKYFHDWLMLVLLAVKHCMYYKRCITLHTVCILAMLLMQDCHLLLGIVLGVCKTSYS